MSTTTNFHQAEEAKVAQINGIKWLNMSDGKGNQLVVFLEGTEFARKAIKALEDYVAEEVAAKTEETMRAVDEQE